MLYETSVDHVLLITEITHLHLYLGAKLEGTVIAGIVYYTFEAEFFSIRSTHFPKNPTNLEYANQIAKMTSEK